MARPVGTYLVSATIAIVVCSTARAGMPPSAHFSEGQSNVTSSQLRSPEGVAVDAGGNVYIADTGNGRVLKETWSQGVYTESTVASGGLGSGVAVDAGGNVYVTGNNQVVKETLSGSGYTASTVVSSGLNSPIGVAVDLCGNVYIADTGNNRVLKETPSGGSYTQSTVVSSGLNTPTGVAVDTGGDVYVADSLHARIVKETLSRNIYIQSTIPSSGLDIARGVAVDQSGNVYIADYGRNNLVLKETLAGGSYTQTTVATEGLLNPSGVAVNAGGSDIYVADTRNNRVLKLQGATVDFGSVDVGGTSAAITLIFTFDTGGMLGSTAVVTQGVAGLDFANAPFGFCPADTYEAGDTCFINVTFDPRFPGPGVGAAQLLDSGGNILATASLTGTGLGPQATFLPGTRVPIDSGLAHPFGLTVDAGGNVFFAESGAGIVYQETLSGRSYLRTAIASGLSDPTGVAVDGSGNLYIAASNGVYKETLSNRSYSQSRIVSDLNHLVGIAVDRSGNVYITASAAGDVHKKTLQATGGYTETAIGSGIPAPTGVAVDGSGNIYVTDAKNGDVYKEALQANGSYLQTTAAGGLAGPESVAVDGGGNLYITGSKSGEVYKEVLQTSGSYLQTITASGLNTPGWIAVDARGNLYLSQDTSRGDLTRIDVADPPSLSFVKTRVGFISPDSPRTVTVSNIGNAALFLPVPGSGANPSIAASFTLAGGTTCPEVGASGTAGAVDAGSSCIYAIDFIPAARGSISGSLVLTDTNLNAASPGYAMQSIALSGTGMTSDATRTTVHVSPNPVTVGLAVTITASVKDTTTPANVPNGAVTFTDSVGGTTVSLNGGVAVPLTGGSAKLNTIPRVAGAHTITAHYDGVIVCYATSTGQASLTVNAQAPSVVTFPLPIS
jgi:sugar lactone lactonase YvrE